MICARVSQSHLGDKPLLNRNQYLKHGNLNVVLKPTKKAGVGGGGGDNTESSKTVKNLYALGFITSPCVLSVCATTTNRLRCDATLNPFTCCSFPSPAAAGCNCDLISAEIPVHYCSVVSVS